MAKREVFFFVIIFLSVSCTTRFDDQDEDGADADDDGPGDMADDTGQDDGDAEDGDAVDIPDADTADTADTEDLPDVVDTAEIDAEPGCGNGIVEEPEECDDGNGSNGDGCEEDCRFSCTYGNTLAGAVQVSAGYLHTCVLLHDGMVRCWGDNSFGQLGNGSTEGSASPVRVVELPERAAAVSGGGLHTCAVLESRGLWCWGDNEDGQLGNGVNNSSSVPVPVTGLGSDVMAVAAGGFHTCAVLQGGALRCWGSNSNGQLGNETFTSSTIPVNVLGMGSNVADAAAGRTHTCAVMADGTVRCWGSNDDGQLGIGDSDPSDRDSPFQVSGMTGAQSITAKGAGGVEPLSHTCVMKNDRSVWCWGANTYGQLGVGTNISSDAPGEVSSLDDAGLVSAGGVHTCALVEATSHVWCWGLNTSGQLGLEPDSPLQSNSPIQSGFTDPASAVSSGQLHTCALDENERAFCWGFNDFGQLGNGNNEAVTGPVSVVCR